MDTLSTSVPNFQVRKSFNPATVAGNHRTLSPLGHHTHHHSAALHNARPQKDNFTPVRSSSRIPPPRAPPPRATAHRRAATGYAAALVDMAQSNGVVWAVERDVRRLLKMLRSGEVAEFMEDERVDEGQKGKVVVDMVKRGKFEGHLVGIVKMVVEKGKKVEVVKEILEEFQRIFDQIAPPGIANYG